MKGWIASLTGLAVVLAGAAKSEGQVRYTVTDLGGLAPTAINNSGQVVGADGGNAFLYSGGVLHYLGSLGGTPTQAYGINNLGQVVGTTSNGSAFLYSNGTMAGLAGTLPGGFFATCANGVNDSGQAVGYCQGEWAGEEYAFLYSNGGLADLGTVPGGYSSCATGINDSGQIVGWSDASGGAQHAFLYSNWTMYSYGTMVDLGTLGGGGSAATAINNSGQVVGNSYITGNATQHAFLYSNGKMTDLGTLGGSTSNAMGINNSGQIVGWAYTSSGSEQPFLYSNGTMVDLNSLISPFSGWALTEATAINDKGQIVGVGAGPSGFNDGFLLTPTPEPSTLALLCAGVAGLLAYSWRRPWFRRSFLLASEETNKLSRVPQFGKGGAR
jgi:probable HAF family extracellular repeat protein